MKVDIRIINGRVVDPERGINQPENVFIKGTHICGCSAADVVEAEQTIDAEGYLVVPGLIDFHSHIFAGGSELSVPPDITMLPQGVTTTVDQGTCGTSNYEVFLRAVVPSSLMRIFSFINVCPAGLPTTRYHEELDPKYYDEAKLNELYNQNQGQCLGLKIRVTKDIVGDLGSKPLEATAKLAQRLGCPVVVHTTNPPVQTDDIVSLLRSGDIYCHVHQGSGETILNSAGKVRPAIRDAQRAGIIFDAANGRVNFSSKIAEAALAEGFFPDIISTDVTRRTAYRDFVFGLPYIMMKYLNLGMSLEQVIAACTSTPARVIGMKGKIGTLAPGALGDVAIFREAVKPIQMKDNYGGVITGDKWLLPQLTILNGRVVYRQLDFGW
jgi:predicted amidohydrolase